MIPRSRHLRPLLLGLLAAAGCALLAAAVPALAQGLQGGELLPEQIGSELGTGTTDIRITIARVVRVALGLLGTVALLLILYAGFLWMTAAGDDEKIARAKKTLSAAVIGLVIILSAFGIVSFILNALVTAVAPPGGGPGGGGGGGGGGGFGAAGGAFRPTAIQPSGTLAKRDVTVAVTFSSAPTSDTANILANVLLERVAGGARTSVDYEPVVENNTIRLVPVQPCPAPNEARRCLEADADYAVTVRSGLKNASTTDPRTVNCGISAVCSQSFHTGGAVGTQPPTARISSPADGQSLPAGDLIQVQSLLTDDYGVGMAEYFADGAFFAADGNPQNIAPSTYGSQAAWDTASYTPVKTVLLKARVTNIDGDRAESDAVRAVLRPAHCFNGVKDFDEAGPDCGGADCGSCTGAACTDNSQCASGQCVDGACVANPRITDVQMRDGKPGNLVTILGQNFGGLNGTVTFLGTAADGDEKDAALGACADAWTSGRIVVVVPEGAVTGPIRVRTSAGESDATNDANGPIVPDFQVNDIERPGICSVDPSSVKIGQTMTVDGQGFGDVQGASRVQLARAAADCSQVQPWEQAAEATAVSPWTASRLSPVMPNVETGSSGLLYLLRVVVDAEPSNVACIRAEPPEAGTEPRIDFLSPTAGSVGTYVTLFGANFGGGGTVRFRSAAGSAVGDVSFPEQCTTGYWRDSDVTVKVPAKFTVPAGEPIDLGPYEVTVVRADGRTSNAKTFTVNTNPLAPGVCRISPDNGPVGTGVTIYGEGFGDVEAGDLPTLLAQHPDSVRFNKDKDISSLGLWRDTSISTAVPAGAVTGPVVVRSYTTAQARESNAVNFQVRDCRTAGADAACSAGETCCNDGSCRADCAVQTNAGGFAWQFSTGPIPVFPVVLEDATCQITDPTVMPSPNPYRGAVDVCTDVAAVALRFSLPMDPATLIASNLVFESCAGETRAEAPCSPFAGTGTPSATTYDQDGRTLLTLPVSGLQPLTWYRLTVKDRARSTDTPERPAQQLDGDFDGRGGGDYITTFKTGETPCLLAAVDVQPADGLIDAADETLPYKAFPLSDKCVILSCTDRTVTWASSDTTKATVAGAAAPNACDATAAPVSETDPGPAIKIEAVVDGKKDQGNLTVDYANPRVVKYGPANCNEACVNTVAYAYFNTPMATTGSGSVLANVRMRRCRNESCLSYEGDVPLSPSYNADARLLLFGNATLEPDTFYRVIIEDDVLSTSQAPLTGLNFEGNAFSWIFRTRPDANPCGPQRVVVQPPQTTLHYIGEVAAVTSLPLTSPDKCSADGQILNPASFNWGWSRQQSPADPPSFAFLPDVPPGALLNTNPALPAGCSSACVFTGSLPPGTPRCGNGSVEDGEACDTPGTNGCNASCLRTGNSQGNGCGDGTVQADRGEECDEGAKNGQAGSGCTSACLLTGSVSGVSVCGNGSVGVGEACDDGNAQSGDGCGPTCLREGSKQDVYVCGNGALEPGEQCDYAPGGAVDEILIAGRGAVALGPTDEDDPSRPGFACSDACLLRGNPVSCPSAAGCCGNGVIEPGKGEGCDAGAENGKAGSGCSSRCVKTGASPELRAYCGDTVITVMPSDPISGVQNGGGEECEAPTLDANIDPTQVVEARNQCDAGNSCTASAVAAVSGVTGAGGVTVACSCRNDGDCAAFGGNLSCGAGACCYPRPADPDINPKGADECRNALVSILFQEEMDIGSLTGNIIVDSCGAVASSGGGGSWLARAFQAAIGFLRSLVGLEAGASAVCEPVRGSFSHVVVTGATGDKKTLSRFTPEKAFDAKTKYRVVVRGGGGGVKTAKNVGYPEGHNPVQEFSTGTEICKFDAVQMDPASELIQTADRAVTLTATPMTSRKGTLEPLAPVPGAYDWTWTWSLVPEGGVGEPILTLTPGTEPTSASVQAKAGKNGKEQVVAAARIIADTFFDPSTVGQTRVGKSVITTMLCENPWPRRDPATGSWAPYVDSETHFEFFYCRDAASGVLPELLPAPVQGQSQLGSGLLRFCRTTREGDQPKQCLTSADCAAGDSCNAKDLFFLFAPEWKLKDAIGLRVYANPDRLTPLEWYRDQRFSGTTQPLAVDGYEGLKDGRTVYVGAVDKYGDPDLRTYIYVLGYDDRADPRTVAIFDQLVGNTRFNTNLVPSGSVTNVCKDGLGEPVGADGLPGGIVACSSDLDCFSRLTAIPEGLHCDADKDKIRRDLKRWRDLQKLEDALESVRATTGFYPKLESGSFIRGFTTSRWPSWDQQMGAAASVKDPLNVYNRCEDFGSECVKTRKACTTDTDCDGGEDVCRPLFDGSTCFNDRAGLFFCPAGSHAYRYRSIGGVDYQVQADFEYAAYPWQGGDCTAKFTETSCDEAIGCRWVETGPDVGYCETRIETAQRCSGLFTSTAKRCLATGAPCQASADCAIDDYCVPASVPLVGPALGGVCGNGLLEGDEACEIGQEQTLACANGFRVERCSSACAWVEVQSCPGPAQCGDGSVETLQGETCDDGAQNGQYGRCRSGSLGCVKRCVNITKRLPNDFDAARDIRQTCSTNADCAGLPFPSVCTDLHAFCGDGRRTGSEACDDGAQNGQYGRCAWDCRGPGPRCGDFEVTGAEQCDGNQVASTGVCVGSGVSVPDAATISGTAAPCVRDADCGSGNVCALCGATADGLPQGRTKSCQPATAGEGVACTFADWSACKPAGACGNGKVEGAEQCDAGTGNSPTGACLPSCKKNVCNDGFVLAGVEQCDNGTLNGVPCVPKYGLTCNYCKNDCSVETISGAFCGDRAIQAPPETCDAGPVSAWCSRTYTDLANPGTGIRGCSDNSDCLPGVCKNYPGASFPDGDESGPVAPPPGELFSLHGIPEYLVSAVRAAGASFAAPLSGARAAIAELASFVRLAQAGDMTPPSVSGMGVTPDNPDMDDAVTIRATNVTDENLVTRIDLFLTSGGVKVLKQTCVFSPAASPASCSVNVGTLAEGTHTVTVEAYDPSSNKGTGTLDFTVSAAPVVDTTPPSVGGLGVSPGAPDNDDAITLQATNVTDASKVSRIDLFLVAPESTDLKRTCIISPTASPASCTVSIGPLASGAYTLRAEAYDPSSNKGTGTFDFTVTPPADPGSGDAGDSAEFEPPEAEGTPPPEGAPCWSSSDCAPTQYCLGGEGQCIAYNTQCVAEPYSNLKATPTAKKCEKSGKLCTSDSQCGLGGPCVTFRIDGSCNSCSSSCGGSTRKSPFFCGDKLVQPQFGEQCDGAGDPRSTGQGTTYGCREDCVYDPAAGFCGDDIVQASAGELCDQGARGCETASDDNPNLHTKADVVFAVDISGSMQPYIDGISDAILRFVNNYSGTPHRFGLVVFGQGDNALETSGPDGRVVIDLTDVSSFQAAFSDLVADGGGVEPMYDSVYALASAANPYGIDWSSDGHPFIVVVTDEPPPAGSQGTSVTRKTESQVASVVGACEIAGCAGKEGYRVETFVITKTDFISQWDSVMYGETANRFINIIPASSDRYFEELRLKAFRDVCIGTTGGGGPSGPSDFVFEGDLILEGGGGGGGCTDPNGCDASLCGPSCPTGTGETKCCPGNVCTSVFQACP